MQGVVEATTGMFVKEDGGIKWPSIIGIAAGAAIGFFALPAMGVCASMPILGAVIGAVGGLMIPQGIERITSLFGSGSSLETPTAAPAAAEPQQVAGKGHNLPPAQATPGMHNPRGNARK